MKVLNLGCAQSHVFEGWFASEEDFQSQLARGLIECPMCNTNQIEKRPSAPRLNLRTQGEPLVPQPPISADPAVAARHQQTGAAAEFQAQALHALRELVARTEDVGERFAQEARRMHYGEIEPRSIRGRATVEDAVAMAEEGVELMPLPELDAIKHTLQ